MSLNQDTITQQLELLAAHRRTLAHLLQQAAQFGGEVFAPPQTANGIAEARANIARIKAGLREGGVQVDDDPNDEAPPHADVNQTAGVGPRVQSTVTVQDNKGTVIGVQITQPALAPALHQLRAPVGDFVGREHEIDRLVSALSTVSGGMATISGVRGMGGIGKTELAYAAAQRLAEQFPDAQLLVELRGASANPLPPTQALQVVIRAFEREAKLPDDLSQLQALYRSVLFGKRVLILADDAKDPAQVRPLLPPAGCALLVTSRNHFLLSGMRTLNLGTLTPSEAAALLLDICPRIGDHAAELAKLCGYLPLALRVSAELLRENVNRDIAGYLKKLETQRLKHLSTPEDPTFGIEASLHLSYVTLPRDAQSVLAQLSIFPTSFDTLAAATVVAGASDVETVLEFLHRRSLLEWDAKAGRWSLHDLVRAFAAARLEKPAPVQLRYAQYYLKVATRAKESYLNGAVLAGLALFDQERAHIDTGWIWARERAGSLLGDRLVINYASASLYVGELRYDMHHERIPRFEAALAAARRAGNRGGEGTWLSNLGSAYADFGDGRKAITYLEEALVICRKLGHRRSEGTTLGNLGGAYYALGDAHTASALSEQRLAVAREIGDRRGEGAALVNLGLAYADLGDAHAAIALSEQGLVIGREIGDRHGEGHALGGLGGAYYALGDARKAIDFYEQHLTVAREIGDRRGEGNALNSLGLAYYALGDARKAIDFYEQHLTVAREVGDRRREGHALGNLGRAYATVGETVRAIDYCEQCLSIQLEIANQRGEAHALNYLGYAHSADDPHRAILLHEQALALIRQVGNRRLEGHFLIDLGEALMQIGELTRATEHFALATTIARAIGNPHGETLAGWNLGLVLEQLSDLARAAELMQVRVDFEREIGHLDAEKHAARLEQVRQRLASEDSGTVAREGA